MKTMAVRLYGKNDIRLEEFELPPLKDNEILARVVSDSICMSSYKAANQGSDHKRVPDNAAEKPIIIGHEFCGEIIEVGKKWHKKYTAGSRFSIQPALNHKGSLDAPGYSYQYIGGDATFIIIPNEVMEMDCLLEYRGESFFMGSLSEPMSCIVGAFRANYHVPQGSYEHIMGIREGGKMLIIAGAGPMGLGCIDLALNGDRRPALLIISDIDGARLSRAARIHSVESAQKNGIELHYVNTADTDDPLSFLKQFSGEDGFDDIFVMAPVSSLVEYADMLLAKDGCMNFFAGPSNKNFSASINFYHMHYSFHHYVGTSGGNTEDMRIALKLMEEGRIQPQALITHIGGLNAVVETTLNLPKIPGGKKLIYTHKKLALTALIDFEKKGQSDPLFAELHRITRQNNDMWSGEAEDYLLKHAPNIAPAQQAARSPLREESAADFHRNTRG